MSQLDRKTEQDISEAVLIDALIVHDAFIQWLQLLCKWCGWNRAGDNYEKASLETIEVLRELWVRIRKNIPVEKLALIEYHGLHEQQRSVRELIKVTQQQIYEAEQEAKELEEDGG